MTFDQSEASGSHMGGASSRLRHGASSNRNRPVYVMNEAAGPHVSCPSTELLWRLRRRCVRALLGTAGQKESRRQFTWLLLFFESWTERKLNCGGTVRRPVRGSGRGRRRRPFASRRRPVRHASCVLFAFMCLLKDQCVFSAAVSPHSRQAVDGEQTWSMFVLFVW